MNACSTNQTQHFTGCASLAAVGVKLSQLKLFDPIRTSVRIKQKTIKQTPVDKLYDAFISLLAGTHGLVEINTRPSLADSIWQKRMCRAVSGARNAGCFYTRECWATGASHGCHLSSIQSRLRSRLPDQFPTTGCGHERHALWTQRGFCYKRLLCGQYHR